ncbi:protease 4-like, partial [Trifolium medium]|nr:protease 4-like [Trifolium medium]
MQNSVRERTEGVVVGRIRGGSEVAAPWWCQRSLLSLFSRGDFCASQLIWEEIRSIDAQKPVIASMSDVAASAGYYLATGAGTIVAENLTLTGSIGRA